MKSFIEVQFPIGPLSLESYKERKAGAGQILKSLGKWWGSKPLVLTRAIILGSVSPASADPLDWPRDLEIFLKCLTMDSDGMWHRKTKSLPAVLCYEYANETEREELFQSPESWLSVGQFEHREEKEQFRLNKAALEKRTFYSLGHAGQREFCCRVEEIEGPTQESWQEINDYLGTSADKLSDLVQELSERKYGSRLTVGDAFCGGGSIPFEAARLGCDVYAADLNPVAALLTWGALNIIGGTKEFQQEIRKEQEKIYQELDEFYLETGLDQSLEGWRAEVYLYCNDIKVPEWDDWSIPMTPTWVVSTKKKIWVELVPVPEEKRFLFKLHYQGDGYKEALQGTKQDSDVVCPGPLWQIFKSQGAHKNKTKVLKFNSILEQVGGLRNWTKDDFMPRPDDFFQERLYCIKWREPDWIDKRGNTRRGDVIYREPDDHDLGNEQAIIKRLQQVFPDWQEKGWIPSWRIQPGVKTDEPIRTRGWTHWHHLFNPRQLLMMGMISRSVREIMNYYLKKALMLLVSHIANKNSKLVRWNHARNVPQETFDNQALNTLLNYSCRSLQFNKRAFDGYDTVQQIKSSLQVHNNSADKTNIFVNNWITDPPYADQVNYEELSEFFLAWLAPHIKENDSEWYTDSMRDKAIKGSDAPFRMSMAEAYKCLADNMPDDGMQVCMFTHKNTEVWEDLALIMWAAGLQVKQVWSVATETPGAGIRVGNYVQATYNMVLKKRQSDRTGYKDFITPMLKRRVREVVDNMRKSQDIGGSVQCGYTDTDYLLAAQAAAVEVITGFSSIEGIDLEEELRKPNSQRQNSVLKQFMATAKQTASDYLVPSMLDRVLKDNNYNQDSTVFWRGLTQEEKFLFNSLEMETLGVSKIGVFQDLGRSYGLADYESLILTAKANECRTRLPEELSRAGTVKYSELPPDKRNLFEHSITRHIYYALKQMRQEASAERAAKHVVDCTDFWREKNNKIRIVLDFLQRATQNIDAWKAYQDDLSSLKLHLEHWRG